MKSPPRIVARAFEHPQRTALISRGRDHRYEELLRSSHSVAAHLLGSRPDLGEARVAFLVTPGFEHVATQWGIWRAGGVAVPLPATHPPAELEYLIRDAEASYVVTDQSGAERLSPITQAAGATFMQVDENLISGGLPVDLPALDPGRRAMIVYTSGTTGRPKGVVTTHRNIEAQIVTVVTAWEWTPFDRALLVLPLHHVHGIINVVCSALWTGAVCEILPRFDTEVTWDRLASGEVTVFSAVPTIYHRLIQSWDAAPAGLQEARSKGTRRLRLMMSGSSALPIHLLNRWEDITGHRLLERYGMSEVAMALSNPLHGERRPGFVGRPLPGITARLMADGEQVPEGVAGEVELRGDGVFLEYWRRPSETAAVFQDGWFRTGDTAIVDRGDYRLLGRKSVDIIKSGAEKISALEIEEVLRRHPAIDECAVVGVADAEWGEKICAAIETKAGCELELDELREWARDYLAASKIPKELKCVERLPRNAMGKVVKPEIATFFGGGRERRR